MNNVFFNQDLTGFIQKFIDIKNLLDTSKKFNNIKKNIYLWKLNRMYSYKYYYDNIFRNKIHDKITNIKQIYKLDFTNSDISDVSIIKNTHILILYGCFNIKNVDALGNVYELDLSYCENIVDVSKLKNVHTLDLSECINVKDVSMLGNVYNLNLSCCYEITDVSMLGNVHTLNLFGCYSVLDKSMLKNVY